MGTPDQDGRVKYFFMPLTREFFLHSLATLSEFSEETYFSPDFKAILCVSLRLVIYCKKPVVGEKDKERDVRQLMESSLVVLQARQAPFSLAGETRRCMG